MEIDKNNPHSLSLFEKKIKSLCSEIKDKTLAKYFLDDFISRLNELTPNLNHKRGKFFRYTKPANPLEKTKVLNFQRNKFEELELKEFSILFLIINNLDIFRKKVELISEINFSKDILYEFKQKLMYIPICYFFNSIKLKKCKKYTILGGFFAYFCIILSFF